MAGSSEIDFKTVFPNLIIFLGPNQNERLFKQLKKSFNEFQYGPIFLQEERYQRGGRLVTTCRVMQEESRCLATGEGDLPCDAEEQAVASLMEKLYNSCYVIQANPEYFSKKKVPLCALNVDSTQRHIYKVVYLKKNAQGSQFPKTVSGAVDYVENYNELLKYIEDHGRSDSKADLFILNVLKVDRKLVREQCQKNQLNIQFLVGCSDMGIFASRNMSTRDILQQVLADGGKTMKYKLVGPRDRFGNDNIKIEEEEGIVHYQDSTKEEEEVVINPWIADRLIIMERVTQWNELESDKETIFCSVRDCPDTQKFIIEKKRTDTTMIHAEAMIDMNVVGRARGYSEKQVKIDAAKDAMENLRNCCYYIKVKPSYLGSQSRVPEFLKDPLCANVTKIYRIVINRGEEPGQILKQFRSSPQEELYFFLQNFTEEMRNVIHNRAVNMNFLVRWIGRDDFLCVYKKVKPRQLLMELMATNSKENEKYKLIIPPSKVHQHLKEGTTQSWSEQGIQPNEPICGGQRTGQQQWNNVGASQSTTESSAQSQNDTPSWVMKFIQSAPIKNVNKYAPKFNPYNINRPFKVSTDFNSRTKTICPSENNVRKSGDNVCNRYRFLAPTKDQPEVSTSNVKVEGVKQTPSETSKIHNVEPCNTTTGKFIIPDTRTSNYTPTLSERLEKILSEKSCEADNQEQTNFEKNKQMATNPEYGSLKVEDGSKNNMTSTGFNTHLKRWSDSTSDNNTSMAGSRSNKRPYDQGHYFEEEGGFKNKFSKLASNPHRSEQERSEDFSGDTFSTGRFNSPGFSSQDSNVYEENTRGKIEEKNSMNTSQFFRRPEATHNQYNNSLWARDINKQHAHRPNTSTGGQRDFSNLFDGVEPPDTRFPLNPPPPKWDYKRFLHGKPNNNFSKVQKYGKKRD